MPPVDHLHVVLLRRDLRIDDQPALAQAAAACASLGDESRLIVVYIYDPELLRHPTSSTAHYLFIDDCLAELEAELAKRGSALFLRSGLLCGVLEMFTKMCVGMSLWSNRTCGVAAERARDEATRQWCAERGVKWNDLPSNGVLSREECCGHAWHTEEYQQQWARKLEAHLEEQEAVLPARLPPPPEGLRRGTRLGVDALARLGANAGHGITRAAAQRGGSRAGLSLLSSFLTQRSLGYRSRLSSPVTAPTSCSRLSPHLAWGALSLRQIHRRLRERCAVLAREVRCATAPVATWHGTSSS